MARFDCAGLDEAIRALGLEADAIASLAPAAVQAGGEVLREALSKAAPVAHKDGGQLAASLTVNGPYHTVADGYYVEVFPDGTRRDGERNATVGYVQEYGRSNMPAQPWMRPTLERSAEAVAAAIAEVLKGGNT